jgi:hypothetical protein
MSGKVAAKSGEWESIARAALDARDKLRKAYVIAADLSSRIDKHWMDYEWVSVSSVRTVASQLSRLIGEAGDDLTQGLKNRGSKSRRSVIK